MPGFEQAPFVPGREFNPSYDGADAAAVNQRGRVVPGWNEDIVPAYTKDAEGNLVMNTNFPEAPKGYRGRHNKMGGILRLLSRH